jgi:hypothetical protein
LGYLGDLLRFDQRQAQIWHHIAVKECASQASFETALRASSG